MKAMWKHVIRRDVGGPLTGLSSPGSQDRACRAGSARRGSHAEGLASSSAIGSRQVLLPCAVPLEGAPHCLTHDEPRIHMNAVTTANLVGITGLARRLVQDGALDEASARDAMAKAAAARQPLPTWFAQNKVVGAAQLAAANAVEFGMPLFDVSTFDASQNAMSLVSEELLRKHNVLPLFKRGGKLFVGTSNPTHSLDEIKFHTNLVVEPILVDEDQIRRTLEQWHASHDTLGDALGAMTRAWETWMSQPVTKISAPAAAIPASTPRATTPRW